MVTLNDSILNKKYDRDKFTQANKSIWAKLEAVKGESFKQYRQLIKRAEKGEVLTDFPVEILIKTTLNCNHFCPRCPHGTDVYPKGQEYNISFETLKKVLDEGREKGLQSVVFTGGEPTMHPEFVKFIEYTGSLEFPDVSVITNGSLLSQKLISNIIKAGVTRINVSFDSIKPETYKNVRGVDHYHKVLRNIDNLLEIRDKVNSATPLLSISFVLQENNADELDEFITIWDGKADGGIKIYPYKDLYSILDDEFFSHQEKGKVSVKDIDTNLLPKKLTHEKKILEDYKIQCTIPWYRCHLAVNGDVQACTTLGFCDHPDMVMGNIHEQSFEDIWKSDRWNSLREITRKGEYEKFHVCHKCQQSV